MTIDGKGNRVEVSGGAGDPAAAGLVYVESLARFEGAGRRGASIAQQESSHAGWGKFGRSGLCAVAGRTSTVGLSARPPKHNRRNCELLAAGVRARLPGASPPRGARRRTRCSRANVGRHAAGEHSQFGWFTAIISCVRTSLMFSNGTSAFYASRPQGSACFDTKKLMTDLAIVCRV